MTREIYTALRGIAPYGEAEISLADDLSLVRPNKRLLANRDRFSMAGWEFAQEAEADRYLVCKYSEEPLDFDPDKTLAKAIERFYVSLMAIQIIKPIQTLGFIYSCNRTKRRPPMDAGDWTRMASFTDEMLTLVPAMIERVQKVSDGEDTERKNALVLLQLGLEHFHRRIAALLWVMGLEAVLGSSSRHDFNTRLCECLGPDTLVFPDWNAPIQGPQKTVKDVALNLYTFRNKMVHGLDLRKAKSDKATPVDLLEYVRLTDYSEPSIYADVLSEAACLLLCKVLQTVL